MVFVKKFILFFLFISVFAFNSYASLKFSTFNIRNFDKKGSATDKSELLKIINQMDADIIAIEEIYNNQSFEKFVSKYLEDYKLLLSRCGGGGDQNLGFLYRVNKVELINQIEDAAIAALGGVVPQYGCSSLRPAMLGFFKERQTGKEFVAVSVHLKAGSGTRNYAKRWKQYDYIVQMVRSLRLSKNNNIIIMGDFNTTGYDAKDSDFIKFNKMLSSSGTQTASENIGCTSYWSGRIYNDDIEEPSILDHIVYSNNFLGYQLKSVTVGSHCQVARCQQVYESVLGRSYEAVSDHCPVTAHFE